MMRFAYADPPYPGQSAKHYADHPDYAGEVDHGELIESLLAYDGWALSTHVPGIYECQQHLESHGADYRLLAWVKPFAAFKRNVKVAYAWEPVFVSPIRAADPNRIDSIVYRDYLSEPITMKRGLSGAKPERFCWWLFEVAGLTPEDELIDLFPGSGAVTRAHNSWKARLAHGKAEQIEMEAA